jgi:hypothetical protein
MEVIRIFVTIWTKEFIKMYIAHEVDDVKSNDMKEIGNRAEKKKNQWHKKEWDVTALEDQEV